MPDDPTNETTATIDFGNIKWRDGRNESKGKIGFVHLTVAHYEDDGWLAYTTGAYKRWKLKAKTLEAAKIEAIYLARCEIHKSLQDCDFVLRGDRVVDHPAPPAPLRVTDERAAREARYYLNDAFVSDLVADRAEMVKELARHDKISRAYFDLMAIIFRDGGHRRCEIGDDVAAGEAAREVVLAERAELARLRDEADALAKFKAYVHQRLDEGARSAER